MKKIALFVLTIFISVTLLTSVHIPAGATTQLTFTVKPVVLFGGNDEYNIVWENNVASIGYVEYFYNGDSYVVYDEENGVVRSDDEMHSVRIPQKHLDSADGYTVFAKEVLSREGYNIETGAETFCWNNFYGYTGQSEIKIGFISDSHLNVHNLSRRNAMLASIKKVTEEFMGGPDFVVMQGDIVNELIARQEYYDLFEMFSAASLGGQRPIVYAVGNHEKRGFYSKEIEKYLVYDTGEFYGQINYGPISAYVVDIGEDKEDTSISYSGPNGGVVDMERYYPEQLYYFQNHPGFKAGATYTFTMGHGPMYVGHNTYDANAYKYADVFEELGADFHICGHTHRLCISNKTTYLPYPVIEDGNFGDSNRTTQRSVLLTLKDGTYYINAMDQYGATAWTGQIQTSANGDPAKPTVKNIPLSENVVESATTTTEQTASVVPTAAGISTSVLKGASSTTAIVTKPVVFDAGEYYSVVWQTTKDIKSAGYVDIEGIDKTFMDAHGGKLRTEVTHSVRIPKGTLNGKKYTVSSRVVTNYNGYGTHSTTDPLTFGPYSIGVTSQFANALTKTDDYNVLVVANKMGGEADATNLLKKFNKQPDLVVLAGDMVQNLDSEQNFATIIDYANTVSNGSCPVLLLRGENETKGEFAPYLSRVIRPVTPQLVLNRTYYNFKQGSLSVIGLDTATKNTDSYVGYNGYAGFDKIRTEQSNWLKDKIPDSFKNKYNIVFANSDNLNQCAGVNFTKNFKQNDVHLSVTTGQTTSFTKDCTSCSRVTIGDSHGVVINCKNDVITVTDISSTTQQLGQINTGDITYAKSHTFDNSCDATCDCGYTRQAGHVYGEYVSDNNATTETDGTKTRTCYVCGHKDTVVDEGSIITGVVINTATGERYESLEDGLENAKEGDTFKLTSDVTCANAILFPGVSLDLNGYKLTTGYVIGFNGSNICDNNTANKGKLYVAKDRVTLGKTNPQLPVYDAQNGCYVFLKINLARTSKFIYSNGTYTAEPVFGDSAVLARGIAKTLFAQGTENNGVNVRVRVSWVDKNGTYKATQDYTYTDEMVNTVVSSFTGTKYNTIFSATFSEAVLTQGDSIKISTIVDSDTDVEISSGTITVNTSAS